MTFLLIMLYKFKCYCVSFDKSDVTHIISSQSHFWRSFLFTVLLGIGLMRLASKRAKLPKSQEDKTKPYLSEGYLVLNDSISGSYLVIPQQQNSLFLPKMSHAQLFAETFQYSVLPQNLKKMVYEWENTNNRELWVYISYCRWFTAGSFSPLWCYYSCLLLSSYKNYSKLTTYRWTWSLPYSVYSTSE